MTGTGLLTRFFARPSCRIYYLTVVIQYFCRGAAYMCTALPFFPIILIYALRN